MEFWTRGEAPTFEEFARSWTKAKAEEHRLLTPEYAYLTDLKHHRADSEWKAVRKAKAKSALKTLARVAPVCPGHGYKRSSELLAPDDECHARISLMALTRIHWSSHSF